MRVKIPKAHEPIRKTAGSKWGVEWEGRLIVTGLSDSQAKTWCKFLRQWLRYLFAGNISSASFQQSFDDWATAAGAANGGFVPVVPIS